MRNQGHTCTHTVCRFHHLQGPSEVGSQGAPTLAHARPLCCRRKTLPSPLHRAICSVNGRLHSKLILVGSRINLQEAGSRLALEHF